MVQLQEFSPALENERVRVYDLRVRPGDTWTMHSHPDFVVYAFNDCFLRTTLPDGTAQESTIKAGVTWQDAVTHETTNIGTTDFHALIVELK